MICRKCGNKNPSNARHCIYCGEPIYAADIMPDRRRKQQKTTEGVVVSLIIVLVLVLVIAAGIFIYNSNSKSSGSFGGSGGGMQHTATTFPVSKLPSAQDKTDNPPEDTEEPQLEEPQPTEPSVPEITQQEKLAKKDEFLDKADEIVLYSEMYLETADNQYEINSESSIVFQKWDDLLNEVYGYLKAIMNERDFRNLEEDELEWIAEKENAIEEAAAEWQGGSGEIMARNMTAIEYTVERCYYLISLIN